MLKFVKLMAKTNEVEGDVYAAINLEHSSLFYLEDEHKNYVYEIAASKGYGAYEGVVYTSYILIGDNLEPTIMILASGEIANDITSGILEIERLYEDGAWVVLYPTRGFNSISMEFDFIEPEEIPSLHLRRYIKMKFNFEQVDGMMIHLEDLAKNPLCYKMHLLVEDCISLDKTSDDGFSYFGSIDDIMDILLSITVENTSEYEAPEVKEYLAEVRKCLSQVYEE